MEKINKKEFLFLTNAEKAKVIQEILKGKIKWENV